MDLVSADKTLLIKVPMASTFMLNSYSGRHRGKSELEIDPDWTHVKTLVSLFRQRRRLAKSSNLDELAIKDNDHRDILTSVQNQFLKIAILISLYPIALIIVNGFITIGDLYISAEGGVHSQSVYGLYCIYYFLYGGRGVVFACLGIFVDPCLRRGLRIARTGDRNMVSTLRQSR